MKLLAALIVALFTLGLTACALPGMRYEPGGSDAWKGQPGTEGYNPNISLAVQQITPELLVDLAHKSASKPRPENVNPEPQQAWVYHVQPGDILSVIVWDHPELTNPAGTTMSVESSGRVVRADGSMFYPHAGRLQVAGKTPEEIRAMITAALAPTIQSPQVDVRVLKFLSQYVNVVGDVSQPCRIPITNVPLTVIDALNQCQTINPAVGHRDVVLEHGPKRRSVDLYAIYRGTDPLLTQPLVDGDTLYVQDDRWNRVFVIGEVTKQGAINIPVSGLTLADALNAEQIQGINQQTANTQNIYVFRGGVSKEDVSARTISSSNFKPDIYHLDAKSPDALLLADQFHLQPRDIVYVSSASLVNYSRAASLIIPTITTLLQTGILIDRVN